MGQKHSLVKKSYRDYNDIERGISSSHKRQRRERPPPADSGQTVTSSLRKNKRSQADVREGSSSPPDGVTTEAERVPSASRTRILSANTTETRQASISEAKKLSQSIKRTRTSPYDVSGNGVETKTAAKRPAQGTTNEVKVESDRGQTAKHDGEDREKESPRKTSKTSSFLQKLIRSPCSRRFTRGEDHSRSSGHDVQPPEGGHKETFQATHSPKKTFFSRKSSTSSRTDSPSPESKIKSAEVLKSQKASRSSGSPLRISLKRKQKIPETLSLASLACSTTSSSKIKLIPRSPCGVNLESVAASLRQAKVADARDQDKALSLREYISHPSKSSDCGLYVKADSHMSNVAMTDRVGSKVRMNLLEQRDTGGSTGSKDSVLEWLDSIPPHKGKDATGAESEHPNLSHTSSLEAAPQPTVHDDLSLGAEAKMLNGDAGMTRIGGAAAGTSFGALPGDLPPGAVGGRPTDSSQRDPHHAARMQLLQKLSHQQCSFESGSSRSVDDLLRERDGDPEEILSSLGFNTTVTKENLAMRIPERFFSHPSLASGISIAEFCEHHPDIKDYLELSTSKPLNDDEQTDISNASARRMIAVVNTPLTSNKLARIRGNLSWAQCGLMSPNNGTTTPSMTSPTGQTYVSILEPANSQYRASQGHYDLEEVLSPKKERKVAKMDSVLDVVQALKKKRERFKRSQTVNSASAKQDSMRKPTTTSDHEEKASPDRINKGLIDISDVGEPQSESRSNSSVELDHSPRLHRLSDVSEGTESTIVSYSNAKHTTDLDSASGRNLTRSKSVPTSGTSPFDSSFSESSAPSTHSIPGRFLKSSSVIESSKLNDINSNIIAFDPSNEPDIALKIPSSPIISIGSKTLEESTDCDIIDNNVNNRAAIDDIDLQHNTAEEDNVPNHLSVPSDDIVNNTEISTLNNHQGVTRCKTSPGPDNGPKKQNLHPVGGGCPKEGRNIIEGTNVLVEKSRLEGDKPLSSISNIKTPLLEDARVQQSFELEEIMSSDMVQDDLPHFNGTEKNRGYLTRTESGQSDSSGFAEFDNVDKPAKLPWESLKMASHGSSSESEDTVTNSITAGLDVHLTSTPGDLSDDVKPDFDDSRLSDCASLTDVLLGRPSRGISFSNKQITLPVTPPLSREGSLRKSKKVKLDCVDSVNEASRVEQDLSCEHELEIRSPSRILTSRYYRDSPKARHISLSDRSEVYLVIESGSVQEIHNASAPNSKTNADCEVDVKPSISTPTQTRRDLFSYRQDSNSSILSQSSSISTTCSTCRKSISCLNLNVTKSPTGPRFVPASHTPYVGRSSSLPYQSDDDCDDVEDDDCFLWEEGDVSHNDVSRQRMLCLLLRQSAFRCPRLQGLKPCEQWAMTGKSKESYKQHLVEEVKLTQHALQKYKLELRMMQMRANNLYSSCRHALSQQNLDDLEDVNHLRSEVTKEITQMEKLMSLRLRSVLATDKTEDIFPMDLASMDVIQQMIELLKEQVYHSNIIYSMDVEKSSHPLLQELSSVSLEPKSPGATAGSTTLGEHLDLLYHQIQAQQNQTTQALTSSLKEMRHSLVEEIRSSVQEETHQLRQKVDGTESELNSLKRIVSSSRENSDNSGGEDNILVSL